MALCDECLAAFQQYPSKGLQQHVDEHFPGFACEQCKVSDHSPGPVENHEQIVFMTVHPNHYDDQTGVLSPIAFEQLTRNDLSVLRHAHAKSEEYQSVRSMLKNGGSNATNRAVDKCCVVPVEEVRGATDVNGRILGVYDTALPDIPSHASLFVRRDYLANSSARLQARYVVLSIFRKHLADIEQVLTDLD